MDVTENLLQHKDRISHRIVFSVGVLTAMKPNLLNTADEMTLYHVVGFLFVIFGTTARV
jgi:hypothetical protein